MEKVCFGGFKEKNLKSYLSKNKHIFKKTDTEKFFSRYAKRNFLTQKNVGRIRLGGKIQKNAEFDVNVEVNVAKFGVLKDNINDSKK
ncbi:MAG: hypothetical protein L6V93_01580 [Clostridiales bacterium]|nr:MAG: hypothetical protein L6V93_01580 [Clostridiales bacterium]